MRKNNSMHKWAFILLFFIVSNAIQAQSFNSQYKDGAIYIKIKNSSDVVWPGLFVLENEKYFQYWKKWNKEYGILEIKRPFKVLKTGVFDRTYEIHFSEIAKTDEFIFEVKKMPFVEYVEKKDIFQLNYTPNDPQINAQYALSLIDAFNAFDVHKGGNSVIAIVDDAVRITHEDIAPNVWLNTGEISGNNLDDDGNGYIDDVNGWDVADNDNDPNPPSSASNSVFSHGTHCAGIASAATDNSKGIASIGFNCKIMAVKASTSSGTAEYIDAGYDGIAYAMSAGADVISLSWGGGNYSQTAQNIINQAHNLGITICAAAGNDASSQTFYPAGYNYVISVASTDQIDNLSSFSNYGNTIDVCAPGSSIYSCVAGSNASYGSKSGTSMACPMVAGLCGLLKSLDPNLSPDDIENCIKTNADNIDAQNSSYIGQLGGGRINALQSIQCVNPTVPPVADFYYLPIEDICPETSIKFYDGTTYVPNTWQWSFQGGTPSTSTDQSPTIAYSSYGNYDVQLIVSNNFGSDTLTKTAYVSVSTNGTEVFYTEDFENGLGQWTVDNSDQLNGWGHYTVGGTSGGAKAAGIELYNYNSNGEKDGLISPSFDLTGRYNIILEFDHAHRRSTSSKSDSLLIYVSTDDGLTYPYRVFGGAENGTGNFATNYILNNSFTPTNLDDWCYTGSVGSGCFSADLSQFGGMSAVKIKFVTVNDGGNNIYIDNIRLTSTCELEEGTLVADFNVDFSSGCNPLKATFNDNSISIPEVNNRFWLFPGGSPSVSTSSSPSINYALSGTYDVMLVVSNGISTDTVLKENYISVNDTGTVSIFNEDFEDGLSDWIIINDDNDVTWSLEEVEGSRNGSKAASMQFFSYNNANGERDYLVSPVLDLSVASNLALSFEHASRAYSQNYTDSLLLYISIDSGETYKRLFGDAENGSGNFATGPFEEDQFTPTSDQDWCYSSSYGPGCLNFHLSAYEGEKAVRIMFVSVNDWGNNHFIDNIKISGTCASSNNSSSNKQVKIYPNPMEGFAVIDFGKLSPDVYRIYDLSGRLVREESISEQYLKLIERGSLVKGIYVIELKDDKEMLYKGKLLLM